MGPPRNFYGAMGKTAAATPGEAQKHRGQSGKQFASALPADYRVEVDRPGGLSYRMA